MISVSHDQLLRYTLLRQGLLERQPSSALDKFGVLHATDHTTPYLSLLARLEAFQWETLTDALYEDRSFVRLRCMRGTVHLVPAPQVQMIHCAYDLAEDEAYPPFTEYNILLEEAQEVRTHIIQALQNHGAQSSVKLKKLLPPEIIRDHENKYGKASNIGIVLRWLWALGLVDAGAGVGNWRSKDQHYRLADADSGCQDPDRRAADLALCRWYFECYAPAAFEDWTWWSGFSVTRARAVFDVLKNELVEVSVTGINGKLWAFPAQAEELAQTSDTVPEMARLLPYEDALIKAYKLTRHRFYDQAGLAEDVAFTKGGEAEPTLWIDGRIVGVWEWSKKANEPMAISPFTQITKELRKRIKPEAEIVQKFIEASHLLWSS